MKTKMDNFDTTGHILWPYEPIVEYCSICGAKCEYELTDIDEERVCDRCASDLINLRDGN